mgnify:CR=1 FL=1
MRSPGFYWVYDAGLEEWSVAEWNPSRDYGDGSWFVCGGELSLDDDYFTLIGPQCEPPPKPKGGF